MRAAELDEADYLDDVQLPHDHPSRAIDALRVLRVLTDRSSGSPVASATTSLPEHPGGDRQYDYRYTWLRDAAYAVATASLLGRSRSASEYLDFVDSLLQRYGDHLMPMTTTTGDPCLHPRLVVGRHRPRSGRRPRCGAPSRRRHVCPPSPAGGRRMVDRTRRRARQHPIVVVAHRGRPIAPPTHQRTHPPPLRHRRLPSVAHRPLPLTPRPCTPQRLSIPVDCGEDAGAGGNTDAASLHRCEGSRVTRSRLPGGVAVVPVSSAPVVATCRPGAAADHGETGGSAASSRWRVRRSAVVRPAVGRRGPARQVAVRVPLNQVRSTAGCT